MSKKKVLSIILGLVVILTAVSYISYAIATSGKGNKQQIATDINNYGLGAGYSYTSNIDLIIQNSLKGEYFNIIEVIPNGQVASDLSKYATDAADYFKKYVIDANSSENGVMAAGMIRYDAITVNPTTSMTQEVSSNILGTSTLQELLDSADLIYVSSQYYTSYDGNNNMSEAVYNFLHTYALGSNKPIIMDYVRKTDVPSQSTKLTYSSLVNLISNNHIRFRTFGWNTANLSAEDFFKSRAGSHYLRYPVDSMATNGTVLVITNGNAKMQQGMLSYPGGDNALRKQAYYGQGIAAGALEADKYTVVAPGNVSADSLSGYDFILIEDDVMDSDISQAVYNQLRVLSESSKYIIYDSTHVTGNEQSGGITSGANNYLQLMDLLISNKGVAKYSHVLPVANGFFTSLYNNAVAADTNADLKQAAIASAKAIADIIGAGDYRGSLMDGANGRKFRVLEIQPCYPIDLELAEKQGNMTNTAVYTDNALTGNYYTDPGNVLMGKSEDEVEKGTEYYKFELSRAKLVAALDLPYEQIELDQMSTEAFISDKNVVLETYDLVYIGGNSSALMPNLYKSPFASGGNGTTGSFFPFLMTGYATAYEMYTHNGSMSGYFISYTNNDDSTAPYGATEKNTVVQTNGNDLTLIKYNELKDYIDAGMPILFSSVVSKAFENAYVGNEDSRLAQLANSQIDPDSRMFYILKYAYEKKDLETVVWSMDITDDIDEDDENDYYLNKDNQYGNTFGSYVHLFKKDTTNADILKAAEAGAERPSFKIVSKPLDYIQGNESTYNENKDGTMSVVITLNADIASACTATMYVDADSNGSFSEDEVATKGLEGEPQSGIPVTYGNNTTLTYSFPYDDFYGMVSWKIVVTTTTPNGGTVCDMKYGYSYFKRQDDVDEKQVKVLQIMPVERVASPNSNTGGQDKHSLYLCTECQQAKYLATYNISSDGDFYANTAGNESRYGYVDMGLHEHKFGIVKYDTAAMPIAAADTVGEGSEDWDYNFADEIEYDYDFDIDILLLDDLHQYTQIIKDSYVIEKDTTGNTTKVTSNVLTEDPFDHTPLPAGTLAGDYFEAQMDYYEGKWEEAKLNLEHSGTEEALIQYLRDNVEPMAPLYATGNDLEGVSVDDIEKWIEHRAYYRYFFYMNAGYYPVDQGAVASGNPTNLKDQYIVLYSKWIKYNDEVVRYHQLYNKYSCVRYSSDEWLLKNYDVVVLGFAEDFNNKDLNVDECNDIRTYLQNGGMVLLTHDTTTRHKQKAKGSYTLTTELRNAFGLDRYHVTLKDDGTWEEDSSPEQITPASINGYSEHNSFFVQVDTEPNDLYGPVALSNHNVTVNIVLDSNEHEVSVFRDNQGNTRTYHKPYSIVVDQNTTLTNGNQFQITYNFYDTVADYESGTLSSAKNGGKLSFGYTDVWNGQIAIINWQDNKTVTGGTATMSSSTYLTAKTLRANNPILYRKFVIGSEYTTLPSSHVVDPTKTKYYFTELSKFDSTGEARVAFDFYVKSLAAMYSSAVGTILPIGVTDSAIMFDSNWMNASPYRYAEYNLTAIAGWNQGITNKASAGTRRASKVNDGIITVYPFKISDELRISATHGQQYALDLEDSNATAWFTLSGASSESVANTGSSLSAKEMSSFYAASPYDGLDSYFLYTYQYGKGTVVYSGAGNAVVTGPNRNNNDERRLYLNVIVNSVRNKGSKPKITVHEKNRANTDLQPIEDGASPNTNPYLDSSGNYQYKVGSKEDIPEFDYKVKVNSQTKFEDIYVFYDLNYGVEYREEKVTIAGDYSSRYTNNAAHVLIYHYTRDSEEEDKADGKIRNQLDTKGNEQENILIGSLRKDLYATGSGENAVDPLKLKPSYFDPYGGTYTYMVIWARDMDGKTSYQRIKISLIPQLFDLTDNNAIQEPVYYFKNEAEVMDFIDKMKFDM